MTDLRHPLAGQMERLAMDLTIERHDDPHAAAVVLLYPDEPPRVVMVSRDRSPFALSSAKWTNERKEDEPRPGSRAWLDELREAADALRDALAAIHEFPWHRRRHPESTWRDFLRESIGKRWEQRRMAPITAALEKAEHERKRPMVCPHCKQRFTVKGLPFHLAKNYYCSRAEAAAHAAEVPVTEAAGRETVVTDRSES